MQKKSKKHIISIFTRTISLSSILIVLAIIIIPIITIYALFNKLAPKNVLKSLEEEYKGEKFEIIEDFGAEDSNSKGLYIVSPKNNKDIQFKMLNTTKSRSDNDYSAQRTKYYIEHCEEKELLEDVKKEETTVTYQGVEFLRYSLHIELNNYAEIDEKTEKAYKLAKYLHSQDSKMFESIFLDMKDIVSLITISCDTKKSLEEEIYSVKYQYIQTLYDNDKKEELQKIGSKEIDKVWKPKYLQLIVNGKDTNEKAQYNLENREYGIVNITRFLKQIDKIEIVKIGMFSDEVKKIKYSGKTYKIKQGWNSGENKNNVIYTEEGIDSIIEKINGNIEYDYSNKKIYITI